MHIIEAVGGTSGREWDVVLIESGLSKNGNYYPSSTLQAAAGLFEGAFAFADHASADERRSRPERSVRDKVGRFSGVTFGQHEVGGRVIEGLRARLKVIAPWLRETLKEAVEMGEPDFLGLSIDAEGRVTRKEHGGRAVSWVESIARVNSVDVVTDPAAGGRIVRLVASNGGHDMDPNELKALLAEAAAAGAAAALADFKPAAVAAPVVEPIKEAAPAVVGLDPAEVAEHRRLLVEARLDKALAAATGLSEVGKAHVRRGVLHDADAGRALTEADITARVTAQQEYEAALRPALVESKAAGITVGDGHHEKVYKALQGWFAGEPVDGVRPLRDLREGYALWTNQGYLDVDVYEFSGAFASKYDSRKGHARVVESLQRSSWGEIFADNLYLMMMKEYRDSEQYGNWRKFVSDIESVPDFQTRHWARVGGYGDLSAVSELATYPQLTTPTDEEITYSISKRGGLDDASMEALIDPRSNRLRRIPEAMARSARRTLYKFVLALITTDNPTMGYDSVALYHSSHGNTGTTALSVSGLEATQVAMRDQTAYNQSSEILGARNKIKYLVIPNELEARAERIINPSDGYTFALSSTPDADTSMDPARFKGKGIEAVVYDQLTDATDWWAVADPAQAPTLVMGFLNGQQEPELFVQDDPTTGSVFTADKVTWKCRHIYGGGILDHRSFYRQVVT